MAVGPGLSTLPFSNYQGCSQYFSAHIVEVMNKSWSEDQNSKLLSPSLEDLPLSYIAHCSEPELYYSPMQYGARELVTS